MKILPIEKVREADAYTITNEPIKSIDLMERAGTKCYRWIRNRVPKNRSIKIILGPGNNGGDGLVIARLMAEAKYTVEVIILRFTDKESGDFSKNLQRLLHTSGAVIHEVNEEHEFPGLSKNDIIVDAIFGSGLSKAVKGFVADAINTINSSGAKIIAIDMPSGLYADKSSRNSGSAIIKADYTLSFQFPKYAFFFAENDKYTGNWEILPIGLHPDFIRSVDVKTFFLEKEDIIPIVKPRNRFAHKGGFGHGLLISGSYGKIGAAVLGTLAALKAGAGLITTHIPQKGYEIIQTAVPEGMVSIDESETMFSALPDISAYNAIAVGPGIGMEEQTQKTLKLLIQNSSLPIIFDADAINILGENRTWISFIPEGSIFTPHPKEFERLVGTWNDEYERNEMQREFSLKNKAYLILKGAYTAITTPYGRCYFNSTGNPGMATAGSGDVLTGILLGLLSQGYTPLETCLLGVYLHGLAGDIAASRFGQHSLIAGDITNHLGKAYRRVQR